MNLIKTFLSALNDAFRRVIARMSESAYETERRAMEAYLSGAGCIYELEARERAWSRRTLNKTYF